MHSDAINKFKYDVVALYNSLSEHKFNYMEQFNTMTVESKEDLKNMCIQVDEEVITQNISIKEGCKLIKKLEKIKEHPNLLNLNEAENLTQLSYDEVGIFMKKIIWLSIRLCKMRSFHL